MTRIRRLGVVVGVWCLACSGMTPEERAAWEKKVEAERQEEAARTAAATEQTRAWAASYATIVEAIDPTRPSPARPCDDAVFAQALGKPGLLRAELPTIGFESLPGAEPYGDGGDWTWLDDGDLKRLPGVLTGEETNEVFVASWGREPAHRFVAVFVATDRVLPSAITGVGVFSDGGFDTGVWDGQLRIVDLEARAVLCAARVQATNSASVDFDDRGAFKDDPAKVTLVDFKKNLEASANRALEGVAPRFKVNFVGLF